MEELKDFLKATLFLIVGIMLISVTNTICFDNESELKKTFYIFIGIIMMLYSILYYYYPYNKDDL
jgi:uncharacterized membrane protein